MRDGAILRTPYEPGVCLPCDDESHADLQVSARHLRRMGPCDDGGRDNSMSSVEETTSSTEWTIEEEIEIRQTLKEFVTRHQEKGDAVFRFPTKQGSSMRKLVYFCCDQMGLKHFTEGKKKSEKCVVVMIKRSKDTVDGGDCVVNM